MRHSRGNFRLVYNDVTYNRDRQWSTFANHEMCPPSGVSFFKSGVILVINVVVDETQPRGKSTRPGPSLLSIAHRRVVSHDGGPGRGTDSGLQAELPKVRKRRDKGACKCLCGLRHTWVLFLKHYMLAIASFSILKIIMGRLVLLTSGY